MPPRGNCSPVAESQVPLDAASVRSALEEAPVNNTLSDAVQEPAVSNMSVAMVMAPACAQHLQAAWSCSLLFISASSRAGCPMGPPCPLTGPNAGTGLAGLPEERSACSAPVPHRDGGWGSRCPPVSCSFPYMGLVDERSQVLSLWRLSLSAQGQAPSFPSQPLLGPARLRGAP